MPKNKKGGDVEIGKRVRMLRNAAGLSQTDLGAVLDVTFQQVQKYEKGVNRIGARQLQIIAAALKCSVADLLGGDSAPNAEVNELLGFMSTPQGMGVMRAFMAMTPSRRAAVAALMREFAQ